MLGQRHQIGHEVVFLGQLNHPAGVGKQLRIVGEHRIPQGCRQPSALFEHELSLRVAEFLPAVQNCEMASLAAAGNDRFEGLSRHRSELIQGSNQQIIRRIVAAVSEHFKGQCEWRFHGNTIRCAKRAALRLPGEFSVGAKYFKPSLHSLGMAKMAGIGRVFAQR